MRFPLIIRGIEVDDRDIGFIRSLIESHKDKSRYYLSKLLAKEWEWVQFNGRMKDRACRDILSILEQNVLIKLPPLQKFRDNIRGNHDISKDFIEIRGLDTILIACSLRSLLPLSFKMVCQS